MLKRKTSETKATAAKQAQCHPKVIPPRGWYSTPAYYKTAIYTVIKEVDLISEKNYIGQRIFIVTSSKSVLAVL